MYNNHAQHNVETTVIVQLTKLILDKEINAYSTIVSNAVTIVSNTVLEIYMSRDLTYFAINVKFSSIFCQAIIGKFESHEHMAIYRLSILMDINIYCEFDCTNLTENDESNQSRCRGKKNAS